MIQAQKEAINKFYRSKDIAELVIHQIQCIQQTYLVQVKYDQINIHLSVKTNISQSEQILQSEYSQAMRYLIVIGKGYPLTPPKIYFRSGFDNFPNINDCRDMFKQVAKQWSYSISLNQLISLLKSLWPKIMNIKCPLKRQKLGQFVLGTRFRRDFLQSIDCSLFQAFQNTQNGIKFYIVCVTDSHFLIFKSQLQPFVDQSTKKVKIPSLKSIDSIWLYFVSDIQAISELKISNQNYLESILTFNSVKIEKMKIFTIKIVKHMKIDNFKKLAQQIFQKIVKFQGILIKIESNFQNKEIQLLIMQEIAYQQKRIHQKFCFQNIKCLQQSYQRAVQHYSGSIIPYQQIFINKMALIYYLKDVRQALDNQNLIA